MNDTTQIEIGERYKERKVLERESGIYHSSAEQTESIAKLLLFCFDIHFFHKAMPGESWPKSFTVRPRKDTHGVTYNNTTSALCHVCLPNSPIIF
jgi:hypothetical protein